MIKIAVIIPFRSASASKDWVTESAILKRTIKSVLNQSYGHFKVYIIYTDAPLDQVKDARVEYVQIPFPFQEYHQIDHRDELMKLFKSEKLVVARWDKGKKISYGSKLAKEEGCDYIMSLDSDDLLSNKLFAHCVSEASKKKCSGWYAEKGYIYQHGSNFLIRVPKMMRYINGSSHILKSEFVEIPDFISTKWEDYNLFTDHGWTKQRIKETYNELIEPIPFPVVTYVAHKSNISKINSEFGFQFRKIAKRIIRGVWLTRKLRAEFNIGLKQNSVIRFLTCLLLQVCFTNYYESYSNIYIYHI
jgi:glycosyltransferase involved in cell wall biosynthesis